MHLSYIETSLYSGLNALSINEAYIGVADLLVHMY